jgi:hypothetical protein
MKKLLTATAVMLITAVCALAQINPQVYYTFDNASPLTPTIGTTSLTAGSYTLNSGGLVGKYVTLPRATNQQMTGQAVPVTTGITVEFLFKAEDGWDENRDPIMFWIGNMNVRFAWPNILFYTSASSGNDNMTIDLQRVGPATWSYYRKGWHHMAFTYNASTGYKAMYIDGTSPSGFNKTLAGGTITAASDQRLYIGSNQTFQSGTVSIDEVAVYNQAISANEVYGNYRSALAGQHYTFTSTTPPAAPAVTAGLDINEFPLGYVLGSSNSNSVSTPQLTQLKNYPRPRYRIGTTAPPNFNWMAIDYMSGYFQPGVTQRMVNDTAEGISLELCANWNYYFLINPNLNSTNYTDTTTMEGKLVAVSNRNRQYKTSAISFWVQQNPRRYGFTANGEYMTWQNCPANNYIRNSGGAFVGANGAVSTTKYRSPASPLDSIKLDASTYRRNLSFLASAMTDTLNLINDNDEILTLFDSTVLRADPTILAAMGSAGFGNMRQYAAFGYQNMFKLLKDSVRTNITAFANTGFSMYQVDGWDGSISQIPYYRWNFAQYKKCNEDPYFGNTSTFDFYPRYVWNWRKNAGAWRGLQPWIESRNVEQLSLVKYNTPFVGAGWNVNEEQNMRPAQWLGLLKVIGMMGARSYYTGYFNEAASYTPPNPPPADPKGYIWQAATPSYAQAACDWVMDNAYTDTLLAGDVPNNYQFPTCNGWRFYSGSEEILTAIRKKNSSNQYAIATAYVNSTSMIGGTPLVDTAVFTLQSKTIQLQTRRQGSVYCLDLNKDTAVVIQYDDWHEYKHPQRWSQDMYVQAEHYGAYVSREKDVRTIPYQSSASTSLNFLNTTTFLTYRDSASYSRDTLSYQVNVPTTGTYYLWVRMRSLNGTTSGFSARLDNGTAFTQNNVIDTSFLWYRISVTPDTMKWTGVTAGRHTVKLFPTSARTEIDQFLFTSSTSVVLPEGTPGSATPCGGVAFTPTISPSGPVTQCGGTVVLQASAGNAYVWSNGQTTQSITVSTTGSYSVTVTDGAGCTGTSTAVSVTINPSISASVTPSSAIYCGSNVTLSSSPGTAYIWSTGATTQTISVGVGVYTVTVSNASGCTATASGTVTNGSAITPTISPSGTVTQCGGLATLTSSPAASYLWSNGLTTQTIAAMSGTYSVTVTSAGGCTGTSASVTVVINTPTTASVNPSSSIYCGTNVTLTASAGASYQWSTGAVTQNISVGAGTYTVTVTSANGCTSTASGTVTNGTASTPTVSPAGTVIQCGGTVTLTSSSGTSYAWNNGATTQSINVSSGTYTVRVTNSSGCSGTSAPTYVILNGNPSATISPSGTVSLCNGSTQTLTAGTATSYQWSTGATTKSINVTTAGSYTVTVTNSAGCTASSSATTVNYVACTCPAPEGVAMTNIWKSTARVGWTYNSNVTRYKATITQVSDPTKTQTKYWTGGTIGITFAQLRSQTQYMIVLTPTCGSTAGTSTVLYFVTR